MKTKISEAIDIAGHRCGICILAGGLSQRMGQNKAVLRLGRRTLLGHIRVEAEKLGLIVRVIRRDAVPRCGPLGGVVTALRSSRAESELFLACDMPFVSAELMKELLQFWHAKRRAAFVASAGGAGFPFLVPVRDLPVVERQIGRQEFSLQKLAQALEARLLKPSPDQHELFNVNTLADWRCAKSLATKRQNH